MQSYDDLTLVLGEDCYQPLRRWLNSHGYRLGSKQLQPGEYHTSSNDRLEIWPAACLDLGILDFFGNRLQEIIVGGKQKHKITLRDNRLIMEDGVASLDDWIVHPHYGIGKYMGRRRRRTAAGEKEYIVILYAGGDVLSVPVDLAGELMPYLGSRTPRWTRLHSPTWTNTKKRIVENLVTVARELLLTQASRTVAVRPPFVRQPNWQQALEDNFSHSLTADQETALMDIDRDLCERDRPMDRLLSGDVGFGKTEVALRAAATVLGGGRSVLVLAPTTVLVEQHYQVWRERFAALPVKVRRVSRLQRLTAADRREIAAGHYDILIGTHQLFSLILPKTAGLLVIDEEQRFGVRHKEHFKRMRADLDVLSLSATPIPRTLYLGLSGVREMSVIRTPPGGRQEVETIVRPYDESTVASALTDELARRGQIYYVHNRVQTLPGVVNRLTRILDQAGYVLEIMQRGKSAPNSELPHDAQAEPAAGPARPTRTVRAAVVHGQSPADWLATVMAAFFAHEIDLLISTAIVENGLDNPRANTLIVEKAEQFGLADLYQLRGRIGRRDLAGRAIFLIGDRPAKGRRERPLAAATRARLTAIADSSAVGSGWELALKDLELRGAGSILGREQHGNLEAIGLVLYSRLLRRVVEIMQTPSSSGNLADAIVGLWRTSPRSLDAPF